jgi:SAM-dependent methyltransferase
MSDPIEITREFGRKAFGDDPANYAAARPGYPAWVFSSLHETCGVGVGSAVLEIGAGAGTATRPLLALGANPLVAIEPDARSAAYLRAAIPSSNLQVMAETFETAELSSGAFDLALSATAFHWLDEPSALAKIAGLVKPGGWWAALWNVFGDDAYPDLFHEATAGVLGRVNNPSAGAAGGVAYAVDAPARIAAIDQTGAFERVLYQTSHWPLVLTPEQTVALYATYSNVVAMPDCSEALAELHRVAETQFGGRVTRNMTTILYLARRRT